jgi:hypothetical protein
MRVAMVTESCQLGAPETEIKGPFSENGKTNPLLLLKLHNSAKL